MKTVKGESNNGTVTEIQNIRPIEGADRIQLCTVCGDSVIIGKDMVEGQKVVYFDSNMCLSLEYLRKNNMFSKKTLNEDETKRGFFGNQGRVKPINLKGSKSYGYITTVESIAEFCGVSVDDFQINMEFNEINDIPVCKKYVNLKQAQKEFNRENYKAGQSKKVKTLMFPEHWSTKHFKKFAKDIPTDRMLYIEEKEHGTSNRTGFVKYEKDLNWYEKLLVKIGVKIEKMEWIHMNGTRRVNLTKKPNVEVFYKGNMRDINFAKLKPNLNKGEQLYFEISGYDTNGKYVQKGFPYGCNVGEHISTLYRITMNMEDGKTYDMGREYVYNRAEELGMRKPNLFEKYHYKGDIEKLIAKVESYTDGKSMVDNKTLREGVVIWFEDKDGKWTCLKHKSFDFINFESKAKDADDFVDIEDES